MRPPTPALRLAVLSAAFACLAVPEPSLSAEPETKNMRREMVQKATRLHDQQAYNAAIKIYQGLLETDPDDKLVLYEISMTYKAMENYENCIAHATRAADNDSQYQVEALTMLASCQDDGGHPGDALATFERAVALRPGDVMLNYNYGVTLAREGQPKKSREAFATAIKAAPAYPSPFFGYANSLYAEEHAAAATLMYLRFLMAEPQSQRSPGAAVSAVEPFLVQAGPKDASGKQELRIKSPAQFNLPDELPLFNYGMSLALAVAMKSVNEGDKENAKLPEAARVVEAVDFMLTTINEKALDADKAFFMWKTAVEPLQELKQAALLEPFLYHVADLAEIEGSREWIDANPAQIEKLSKKLDEFRQRMRAASAK